MKVESSDRILCVTVHRKPMPKEPRDRDDISIISAIKPSADSRWAGAKTILRFWRKSFKDATR